MKKIYLVALIIAGAVIYSFHSIGKKIIFHENAKFDLPLEETQGTKDNPYAASQFRYDMLSIKGKNVDLQLARRNAINYSKSKLRNKVLNKTNVTPTWQNIGPGNIGGRIRSIIIKPSNSNDILIGGVSGGIWKSTDAGDSWVPKLDDGIPIGIGSMVLTGTDTVYAGTGEGWGNIDAVYGGGIYKSTDFGETWTLLSSTTSNSFNFKNVLSMDVDPSGNIYASTWAYNYKGGVGGYYSNGGLYRSTDYGNTWTKISTASVTNYFHGNDVIAITSSTILFATNANGSTLGGIFRTTDSGTNWSQVTSGLPTATYGRIAMAHDPNSSTTVYAAIQSTNTGATDYGLKGIYKSIDSGANWTKLTSPGTIASTSNLSYLSNQGWYDNVIAIDPSNSQHIHVGGVDEMKSTDGGSNWTHMTYWDIYYANLDGKGASQVVHADHHAIVFDPNNSGTVYDGNDGGIYKSTDYGVTWASKNNGLEITQFYGGAISPTGTAYYGGAQDNGHLKFSSGTNWDEKYGGDGGYAALDPSDTSIAYEEYVYLDIHKTTDGGTTWYSDNSGIEATDQTNCLFIAPFSMNPENSDVLIAGTNKVWITTDSAHTWNQSSSSLVSATYEAVSAVTVVNSSADYLGFAGTTEGKIYKCSNLTGSGDTWNEITPPSNNGAWVRRIVVDQSKKQHIYACYSGFNNSSVGKHVWYSGNQGTNWTDISGDLPDVPVHSLVIDPVDDTTLYIGTETGVYNSTNGGTNWIEFNIGMPSYVPVDELVLQSGTNQLYAFTHGRSVWMNTTALPVELSAFNAEIKNGKVHLKWETATEVNNYGFDIERLAEGSKWVKIGFISGAGNSSTKHVYSYIDEKTKYGKYSYRLKQIDHSGHYQYSKEVELNNLNIPSGFALEQNYPNPFNPATKIDFISATSEKVTLKVYDAVGKEVATLYNNIAEAGKNYEINFNASNISSGVYYYRLSGKNINSTKKMIVLK